MLKVDKIKIAGTQYDRRVKLTNDQKADIKMKHEVFAVSYNYLAREYGVSKRLINFICKPESYRVAQDRRKANAERYKVSKDENTRIKKEHRQYKKKLYQKGLIK